MAVTTTALQLVDFINTEGDPVYGLVPVHVHTEIERIDEASVIHDARSFQNVDYVFFRRFSDGRSSQVAAFVVDNSREQLSEATLAKLHHQLWLHGAAPLMYVSWPSRIDILSCARGPDFWIDEDTSYEPADRIVLPPDALDIAVRVDDELKGRLRRFSALRLADGTFWDDPANNDLADHEEGAHYRLIQAIVDADLDLDGHNKPILRRLLVLTVLIKYLEDRSVFPEGWFAAFHEGAKNFLGVLASSDPAKVLTLLNALQEKFRGDLFSLPKDVSLDADHLASFATLVEARTIQRQRFLWEQYSFQHLPVEVISRIYQRFVSDGHGAFYTPPLLATMLLDHCLPYERLNGDEQILDPSCGSGIFLVGAFKRLVNVWRSRNDGDSPDVAALKGILRHSIFGIELHPGAVDLAAFSLALAICDALKPKVIWNELQFDPVLGTNLLEGDFFSLFHEGEPHPLLHTRRWPKAEGWPVYFDVVVGNPPFESSLTDAGKQIDKILSKTRGALPDKQAAYLFLEQAAKLVNESGRLCLLQPYGFLYNRNSAGFRKNLFRRIQCEEILDFISIRNLFDGADTKTIAVHTRGVSSTTDRNILHLTFRRTFSATQRIGFELDHYDRHQVPHDVAADNPYIWKANLLGGGRLVEMSARLASARTLLEVVRARGWVIGEGFIVGNKKNRADYLTGLPLLPTTAISADGIAESKIGVVGETHFERPRPEELYQPPLVLIKEHASLPMVFWNKGPLAYYHSILGIHAPKAEEGELREFFDFVHGHRKLYQFYSFLNGTRSLIGKATANLRLDITELPYPEDGRELELSFWEKILVDDVIEYMAPFVRLGQNSKLLRDQASAENVRSYSETFCRMLGTVYRNLKASEAIQTNGLILQPFYFGDQPRVEWNLNGRKKQLDQLIYSQQHGSLRTVRVVRFYDENVLLIVKPDRLRYWIRSTAIRDADETLIDLRRQGY